MDVLVIVDMQEGMLQGDPKHELATVIERINRIAKRTRESGGIVVHIQHDGEPDDDFAPLKPGWQLLGSIHRTPEDRVVRKQFNDAFFRTTLEGDLEKFGADRVLVTGWATDFCVDATVRSGAALGFPMVVVSDAHTLCDRAHLSAEGVIEHHHWIWTNVFGAHRVQLVAEAEL